MLDVCHAVAAGDIEHGAMVLAGALPYLPVGVHLATVDPLGSSGSSRAVLLACGDGSIFVAPDNGVASLAWGEAGGVVEAYEIADETWWLPRPSPVFRARDIYAPVAARLAAGAPPSGAGPRVDTGSLVVLTPRDCSVDDDHVHGEVVEVDHFGNLSLNMERGDLEAAGIMLGDEVEVRIHGRAFTVPFTVTYGEVPRGRLCVCEDAAAAGHRRRSTSAAPPGRLRAARGDAVVVSRAPASRCGRRSPGDRSRADRSPGRLALTGR